MKLNTQELMQVFGVSYMTIYNWRMCGDRSPNPVKTALPYYAEPVGKRFRIYFVWSEVKKWAKHNRVIVLYLPSTIKRVVDRKQLR